LNNGNTDDDIALEPLKLNTTVPYDDVTDELTSTFQPLPDSILKSASCVGLINNSIVFGFLFLSVSFQSN
jgi:hypothetical protein